MDGEAGMSGIGDGDLRLEGEVQALLGLEHIGEDVRRRSESLVGVATAQMEIERHVGAAASSEMLEIGESAGGLELVVDDDGAVTRRDLVIDRGQLVVFGD